MARKAVPQRGPEEVAARKKRLLLFGCGGLLALMLLISLIVYLKVHAGPALPREIQRRAAQQESATGASSQAEAPSAVPSATSGSAAVPAGTPPLRQQLAQLQYSARAGDTRPQTLYVTDTELNSMLAESFKADEHLRQVRAYFGSGKAYMVGVVNWKGQTLNLTVIAEPVIVNGGLQFAVASVNVGSFAAPAAVTERIQREANKSNGRLDPSRTGLYVDRVDVRDGVAILSGRAVPKTQ